MTHPTPTPRARLALAYLGFVSLGLPDGLLGVAWPCIRTAFALPVDALGALLLTFTLGYLVASFRSGAVLAHINVGTLLALSCLATGLSLLGYALAPGWGWMVALGSLAGLGAGAIDAGLNTYAATHHSPRTVNWLHACYGIGTTSGPLLMTGVLTLGLAWQWGYALAGCGQLLLATCFGLTRASWPPPITATPTAPAPAASASTLRLPIVWCSLAVFFVYTGLEAAVGAWTYSLLHDARGVSMQQAGFWVSAYWGSFTVGRLLAGFLAGRVPVARLLPLGISGMVCGAALVWSHPSHLLSGLGIALLGLAAAPIFPSLIASTPGRLGLAHTANAVGFQIAAAVLGQALLPGGLGVLARHYGLESLGPALCLTTLLLLGCYVLLTQQRLPHDAVQGVAT